MKICRMCGFQIENDAQKFCPECGSVLELMDDVECEPLTEIEEEPVDKQYDTADQKLLIDYYEKPVGTPVAMPYYEIALYTYQPGKLILEEYTNGGMEDEKCRQKIVDYSAYEKAMEVVRNFHLKELLYRVGPGLLGKFYVIKFRQSVQDDRLYRFTSDNIGRDETMMAFVEMLRVLSEYK